MTYFKIRTPAVYSDWLICWHKKWDLKIKTSNSMPRAFSCKTQIKIYKTHFKKMKNIVYVNAASISVSSFLCLSEAPEQHLGQIITSCI